MESRKRSRSPPPPLSPSSHKRHAVEAPPSPSHHLPSFLDDLETSLHAPLPEFSSSDDLVAEMVQNLENFISEADEVQQNPSLNSRIKALVADLGLDAPDLHAAAAGSVILPLRSSDSASISFSGSDPLQNTVCDADLSGTLSNGDLDPAEDASVLSEASDPSTSGIDLDVAVASDAACSSYGERDADVDALACASIEFRQILEASDDELGIGSSTAVEHGVPGDSDEQWSLDLQAEEMSAHQQDGVNPQMDAMASWLEYSEFGYAAVDEASFADFTRDQQQQASMVLLDTYL